MESEKLLSGQLSSGPFFPRVVTRAPLSSCSKPVTIPISLEHFAPQPLPGLRLRLLGKKDSSSQRAARRPAARHHRQRTATTAIVRASKHARKRASTHSSKQAAKSDPPAASIERVHEHTLLQVSDRADNMEHVSDLISGFHSTSFAGSPSGPLPPSPKRLASAIRRPSRWPRGSLPHWSGPAPKRFLKCWRARMSLAAGGLCDEPH